jgi:CHAT domain-containing protein/tetratricopeptide (TPR) repeat protein
VKKKWSGWRSLSTQWFNPIDQKNWAIARWGTVLLLIAMFLSGLTLPTVAHLATPALVAQTLQPTPNAATLDQQGRQRYQAEQFSEAVSLWLQAIAALQPIRDPLESAQIFSNLSLAYQQLGQWTEAETAIQDAIALLTTDLQSRATEQPQLFAQALDVQGRLHLARGQAELALTDWQQAANLYSQLGDSNRLARNQINQAQALQALGLYRQAQERLTETTEALQSQLDSVLKAIGLRSLGNVLRVSGNLVASRQVLQQSLAIAQAVSEPAEISAVLLSLGDTARFQQDIPAALAFYQQAAAANLPLTAISAQLHQLSVLIETEQWSTARSLVPQIQVEVADLPLSRTAVYARIDLAQSLMKLASKAPIEATAAQPYSYPEIAEILAAAVQQARSLEDPRSQSYAIGILGELYEQTQQWSEAEDLTRQALRIAQAIDAAEISYQWQWQLGRLLNRQWALTEKQSTSLRDSAIAAYDQAVKTLQALRYDLVNVNPDVQFSFRDKVEPVYRQFVDLLLQASNTTAVSQDNLLKARDTIEALQLAELDNFFREACLAPRQQLDAIVDQQDPTAAVLYSTILADRIEVILKLPEQPLRHYATMVPQYQVENTLDLLRRNLTEPDALQRAKTQSQQVYRWLIQPTATALAQSQIKTLVFVSDGLLRNIPMAALYDGQQYLIEQYAIALSSSLQLFDPQPLQQERLKALIVGLDEPRQGFSRLDYVEREVEQIQSEVPSQVLFNQQFTAQGFQREINSQSFSIVHLATHGQFSSNADETFILAWDQPIRVNELNTLLQTRDQSRPEPLELLVLSACETAVGDKRAALGLAGVAIRAGARSTVASVWAVNDESTAVLMNQFYQELINGQQTRAEALRQAQLSLLKNPKYQLPLFWAAYVLIGSWL